MTKIKKYISFFILTLTLLSSKSLYSMHQSMLPTGGNMFFPMGSPASDYASIDSKTFKKTKRCSKKASYKKPLKKRCKKNHTCFSSFFAFLSNAIDILYTQNIHVTQNAPQAYPYPFFVNDTNSFIFKKNLDTP